MNRTNFPFEASSPNGELPQSGSLLPEQFKTVNDRIGHLEAIVANAVIGMPCIDDSILFDDYDICTFLRIASSTWRAKRRGMRVRYTNLGGKKYITYAELKKLIEENTIKTTREQVDSMIQNKIEYYRTRSAARQKLSGSKTFSSQFQTSLKH